MFLNQHFDLSQNFSMTEHTIKSDLNSATVIQENDMDVKYLMEKTINGNKQEKQKKNLCRW